MKRVAIGLLVLIGLGALIYVFRAPLTLFLMKRMVSRNLASSLVDELPDGLSVALCGAGAPLPDPKRSGPCVAVIAGKRLYVVDSGAGASRNLSQMRIPQREIEAVFLTHFHSDHIDGMGELLLQRWVQGAHTTPTPVYGPPGVEEVVNGFNAAYRLDSGSRVAHHGEETVPPSGRGGEARPFPLPAAGEARVLVDEDGVKITAFLADHWPVEPAVGYRFDYGGRSVVISGDTKKSENVQRFAKGADLLVHEALAPKLVDVLTRSAASAGMRNLEKITVDILSYHTTPVEAAEVARDAGVKHLLLYHIVPPLPIRPLEEIFLEGVPEVYTGPVTLALDGVLITLPAHSDVIEVDQLL